MTYTEQLQRITNLYIESGAPWPATAKQVAGWAIRQDLWRPQPSDLISQCASQLSRAMREEYLEDPQGRAVRAKHAARYSEGGKQRTLWADLRTAPIIGGTWRLRSSSAGTRSWETAGN
jgi:hypothetical protein